MNILGAVLREAYGWLAGIEQAVRPEAPPPADHPETIAEGDGLVVNGVRLPRQVVEELRRLGLPLSGFNAGELQDAVLACAIDSRLVEDEEGVDFRDKLTLTDEERQRKSLKRGFVERLAGERRDGPEGCLPGVV